MAAVLQQTQDAPAAKVLQPADNPDVDVVPLRFGVKYASEAPMLALEYRDKASGDIALEEIPLVLADDSKALEVYAALKESHARFLAPYVVSVAQVVRLIQLAIDNRGKAPSKPSGDVPIRAPPDAPPTPLSPDVPSVASSIDSPDVLASPASPAPPPVLASSSPVSPPVLASPPKAAPESPSVLASPDAPPASPPEIPTLASPVSPPAAPKFAVGARVEARFEGKATYYAGKITEVTGATYSIAYDDGDRETNVEEDLIRVYAEPKKEDDYSEDDVEEESIAESVGSTASFDASEPSRHQSDSDSDEAYAFD